MDLLSFFVFTTEIYIILPTLVRYKLINFYLSYFTRNTYDMTIVVITYQLFLHK